MQSPSLAGFALVALLLALIVAVLLNGESRTDTAGYQPNGRTFWHIR
jgi:hypothetical protein